MPIVQLPNTVQLRAIVGSADASPEVLKKNQQVLAKAILTLSESLKLALKDGKVGFREVML